MILAFVSLAVISCNKDDDNNDDTSSNFLKVGSTEYQLKAGGIDNYGQVSTGVYNFDITLVTSTVTNVNGVILPQDEIFSGIYFELFTSNPNNLDVGVYQFSTSANVNTFSYGDVFIDASYNDMGENTTYYDITGGSLEVLDNGNTYRLEFEGTLDNGQSFSGSYRGSLVETDESFEGRGVSTTTKNRAFLKK